mmetsp:Transcript_67429/g.130311  ORF Transcript_67429/g.130311 Transcript_67429/m.130311 type:complete len:113 (+) Transcript_67429:2165-2503(+)
MVERIPPAKAAAAEAAAAAVAAAAAEATQEAQRKAMVWKRISADRAKSEASGKMGLYLKVSRRKVDAGFMVLAGADVRQAKMGAATKLLVAAALKPKAARHFARQRKAKANG